MWTELIKVKQKDRHQRFRLAIGSLMFFSLSFVEKNKSSKGSIAIGLPESPRYLSLIEAAKWALEKLEIRIFIVTSIGEVYEQ